MSGDSRSDVGVDGAIDLAIIGGTGVYALADLADVETQLPDTRYGAPSGPIRIGRMGRSRVAFLARHGEGHSVPPHRITAPCGPRALVCPDQLIDYTWGRISTVCEEEGTPVLHVDFGDPYTASLRTRVLDAARATGVAVVDRGCYGATQGPRLETRAEIARMRRDGCDLVGMTGMPEAAIARELGLDYACLGIVANWAAGAGPDPDETITLDDVLANVAAATGDVGRILRHWLVG